MSDTADLNFDQRDQTPSHVPSVRDKSQVRPSAWLAGKKKKKKKKKKR